VRIAQARRVSRAVGSPAMSAVAMAAIASGS
jgi:hypothetical protein